MVQSVLVRANRPILALLLALTIWGSTFAVTKITLAEIGPLTLAGLRFLIAFLILIPLAYRQGFRLHLLAQPVFLLYGLTGVALFYALQNAGLNYTSVTSTVMILASIPALTTVLAVIFLREKLNQWQAVGLFIATLGVIMVALTGMEPSVYSPNPVLGNLLIFGSAVAWAVYTIQGKKIIVQRPALVITAANMGTGLLFLAPLAVVEIVRDHQSGAANLGAVSAGGWAGVFYLGVIATAFTFFLWNYALRYLQASVVSPYISLEPVIGLFSGLLIGESISPVQVLGGSMAILGVWLSSRFAVEDNFLPDAPVTEQES